MSNDKQNINNKKNNFKNNYSEVINELRRPVKCTNLSLLHLRDKKKGICKNLSPTFHNYSASIINPTEITKSKETSTNKVRNWIRNYRHPPIEVLNINEKILKCNMKKTVPEKFKGIKYMKICPNIELVSPRIHLDSSIGTFEPIINSTPLSEDNVQKLKNNDENINSFRKQYQNTINLAFESSLSKNQLANCNFAKQNLKNSEDSKDGIDNHTSDLNIILKKIFHHTKPRKIKLLDSPKQNCNPNSDFIDNDDLLKYLDTNDDKSFVLNTKTILFEESNHYSSNDFDFENFLIKPAKPKENNLNRSVFHDAFEQEFNSNIFSDIFSNTPQPFNEQEISKEFTLNELPCSTKSSYEDLLTTTLNFNNSDKVEDDVNSPLRSAQHLLNLLPEDISSTDILKSKRRKKRKTPDSYIHGANRFLYKHRNSEQSNTMNLSISSTNQDTAYGSQSLWNSDRFVDAQQTKTSELINKWRYS